jgi:hypothetical protein
MVLVKKIGLASRHVAVLGTALLLMMGSGTATAGLLSNVTVTTGGGNWDYTVVNQEGDTSNNWVSTFDLFFNSAITNVGSPNGWDFITDDVSFIAWFNTDLDPPFPHDIAPGTSLDGFTFTSSDPPQLGDYDLTSWDHNLNQPGPTAAGSVSVPEFVQAVPESGSFTLLLFGLAAAAFNKRHFKSTGGKRFCPGGNNYPK